MVKLKTLKDLKYMLRYEQEWDDTIVGKDDLKQEAIKWIKELKSKRVPNPKWEENFEDLDIRWIKHFFNISEEDLK